MRSFFLAALLLPVGGYAAATRNYSRVPGYNAVPSGSKTTATSDTACAKHAMPHQVVSSGHSIKGRTIAMSPQVQRGAAQKTIVSFPDAFNSMLKVAQSQSHLSHLCLECHFGAHTNQMERPSKATGNIQTPLTVPYTCHSQKKMDGTIMLP